MRPYIPKASNVPMPPVKPPRKGHIGPYIFEALRNTQLVEGADGFLLAWSEQDEDARKWWAKAQAEYERLVTRL